MIINPRRQAIAECEVCDHNGMVMIFPATKRAHETLARCPHNAAELLDIKRNAEADLVTTLHRSARPDEPPHAFSEPIHQHDEQAMF